MTQHPSLKIKGIGTEHRSVLKRWERILKLQKDEKWKEGNPVFGLPKVKTIKLKIKKEKAAPKAPEEGVALPPGGETPPAEKPTKAQTTPPKPAKETKPTQESGKKPGEKK